MTNATDRPSRAGSAPLRSSSFGVNENRCSCWYTEIAVRVLVQVTVLRSCDPAFGQGRYADTAAVATTGVAVARSTSSRPAPTWYTPAPDTSCALLTRADFSVGAVQSGCCWARIAAAPATCGVA